MATTAIYVNFARETEEAFNFYKSIFGGEFDGGITRMSDAPADPARPPLAEEDKNLVMHVQLKLPGGVILHGTDAPESMGFKQVMGNSFYVMLNLDSKEEGDNMFAKLSDGGKIEMPMMDMFWGDYFGSFTDKFGLNWMIAVAKKD